MRDEVPQDYHDVGKEGGVFCQPLLRGTLLITARILAQVVECVLKEIEAGPNADGPHQLAPDLQLVLHLADTINCQDV